jgi:hypothetical protein
MFNARLLARASLNFRFDMSDAADFSPASTNTEPPSSQILPTPPHFQAKSAPSSPAIAQSRGTVA